MSLYTPVFPSVRDSNASRIGPPENSLTTSSGKQQNYPELLRDVHLFLSTQSDVLSPPSRPSSPASHRRTQKVKDEIKHVIKTKHGPASSGEWSRVSQTLKLGCVRGRYWSVSGNGPCAPEEETDWILPDEEFEWIEWEKKREENRRLQGRTNASQQISATSTAPGSQRPNRTRFATRSQPCSVTRERPPPDVSPSTLRAAKEKVRKWQASVSSEMWHGTASSSSPASAREVVATTLAKRKAEGQQRSRTLDFAVEKPMPKAIIDKRGKSSLSRPVVRGGSAPMPLHKSKSSTPLKSVAGPEVTVPDHADDSSSKRLPKPVKDVIPKITDVPETPYLPPSFPAHLETSTPLPDSAMVIRAKPSPIVPVPVPASSSTPLPSVSTDRLDDHRLVPAVPHAVNVPSSPPPQIGNVQSEKRLRLPSASLDGKPNEPPATPPAKRLRTLPQNRTTPLSARSGPVSPSGGLDPAPGDDAPDPGIVAPTYAPHSDTINMASGVPSTCGKNDQLVTGAVAQGIPEKIPSSTKSVKSHLSAPDPDPADSPMKANLPLESPVSPMLSYAQNASVFLPQFTSTQVGKGSATAGQTNGGIFETAFGSQSDVGRHVDRVSELLEKEVDFDGWLRDVRTVEMNQD